MVGAVVLPIVVAPGPGIHASAAVASATAASADIDDAREPSITNDGRWVVFGGQDGDRRTVFRTDLDTGDTVELSPLPTSVRGGDTIHPRISADGCVVAAITEVAYDLFRDDDRGDRWDVYRLVVPECGGQPNAWELVSGSARTGIAIDGVFTDSPPALSGSGDLIAYVHHLAGAPTSVGTISLVDITVPINRPGRETRVAGMPAEAPNRAFVYRGARQPALSQDGRHLAFVSDATASDALPGWADGPILGEAATAQVYVWDRGVVDQRRAVRLVSGRDGIAANDGADSPSISEDGRVIAFRSQDRVLVPATLPRCSSDCPTQIYRFDRDTDRNGIFDEPPRRPPLTIVSAVQPAAGELGLPVAGNAGSWAPAVNPEGSQIAFVTDATNLLPSRRAGGGGVDDGDLLVAEFELGQLRRVLNDADDTDVPGAHGNPALSRTGQTIVFETMAAALIVDTSQVVTTGTRTIAVVDVVPQLSLAELDFGTVLMGFESTELYATVLNAGPGAFEPTLILSSSANFKVTGGSCKRGVIVAAGTSCSVNMTFNPTAPRGFAAKLTVGGRGEDAPTVSATVRGAAGDPTLLAVPGGVDVDSGVVGGVGGRVAIDISNISFAPSSVARITLGGAHPDDFSVVTQSCTNRALNPDASCTIEVEFTPTDAGYRSALLIATTPGGHYTSAVLGGFARYEPTFEIPADSVLPGEDLGVGGSGFPAEVSVAIGFDDGGPPFAATTTDRLGGFLLAIRMPQRLRPGQHRLVATASDGVVGTATVEVLPRRARAIPALPGYGVG